MKQYKIQFYKRRNDWDAAATYYREFDSFKELTEWCKDMQTACKYNRYFEERISIDQYLKATL